MTRNPIENRGLYSKHHPTDLYDFSIVGTVGLPARYGGFETLTEHLVIQLSGRYRIQVFCTAKGRTDKPTHFMGAKLDYVIFNANGWQSILYDVISIWRSIKCTRTVLILGVSGCLCLPFIRLLAPKTRLVINVDGSEWKREKWGPVARLILRLSELVAVKASDILIADNEGIRQHIQESYGRTSYLIPYGGDSEPLAGEADTNQERHTRFEDGSYYLTICRIEPENKIEEILAAFRKCETSRYVIVGNWTASEYGRRLYAHYKSDSNVQLLEPTYDQRKLASLRRGAKGCIHGHSAGGTNPTLVQAMFNGTPVLAFDVSFNRFTTDDKASFWKTSDDLAKLLANLTDADLKKNGLAMREYAQQHYVWRDVVSRYEALLSQ